MRKEVAWEATPEERDLYNRYTRQMRLDCLDFNQVMNVCAMLVSDALVKRLERETGDDERYMRGIHAAMQAFLNQVVVKAALAMRKGKGDDR